MKVFLQLEPGNLFKCGCRIHSLTDLAVSRMSFAVFNCQDCGGILEPMGEIASGFSDALLACTTTEDGGYTLLCKSPGPHYSYCSVASPGISFDEAGRRAIVRALYRPGDLDGLGKEPVFQRLFALLNEERLRLLQKSYDGLTLSPEENESLNQLNGCVDNFIQRFNPRHRMEEFPNDDHT